MTIGQEIRAARGDRTLRAVAKDADLAPSYLCDIEFDRRKPPPETLKRIAAVLGVKPDRWLWLWAVEHMGEENAWKAAFYAARGPED